MNLSIQLLRGHLMLCRLFYPTDIQNMLERQSLRHCLRIALNQAYTASTDFFCKEMQFLLADENLRQRRPQGQFYLFCSILQQTQFGLILT